MPKSEVNSSIVVPDSNSLFPKMPTQIASERFESTWTECLKFGKLQLVIPEVVRGERLYQLVSVAQRSLENAEKNFRTITAVAALEIAPMPKIEEIRISIEKRFDDWLKGLSAEIEPVPCDKINWQRVVNDAIWRICPFAPAGEDKDTEKGFRDCLIAETLDNIIKSRTSGQVVFISRDRLLRDATIARFGSEEFAAYEDITNFLSFLTLTHEQTQKTRNEFVQAVLQKAPGVFYSENNPNCVYTKFSVGNRVLQDFSAHLNVASPPRTENSDAPAETLTPASEEKIFIDSTQYEPITKSKVTWGWKTRLRCVRLFRKESLISSTTLEQENLWRQLAHALGAYEMVRVAPFDVFWAARCDGDGNFSELKVLEIRPQQQTWELGFYKLKYGFPSGP
jgi:hypothetical protein